MVLVTCEGCQQGHPHEYQPLPSSTLPPPPARTASASQRFNANLLFMSRTVEEFDLARCFKQAGLLVRALGLKFAGGWVGVGRKRRGWGCPAVLVAFMGVAF